MTEHITGNVFRIGVPLPGSPLKMTNAYLIHGENGGRHLLIDNGFNTPQGLDSILSDLAAMGVALEDLDFFITHVHADHNGLTPLLRKNPAARVWAGAAEISNINRTVTDLEYWQEALDNMKLNGFPSEKLSEIFAKHPARMHAMPEPMNFDPVREGDILEYGGHSLEVIDVPGHSPAQTTLFDAAHGLYFSGDHILGSITPNITHWDALPDALGVYLASLDKIRPLSIKLTLPGHRAVIKDTRARIDEIKEHHAARLEEVLRILAGSPRSAYDTAALMTWAMRYDSWDDFPVAQKWFATGEALSHLEHLEATGRARRLSSGGLVLFALP